MSKAAPAIISRADAYSKGLTYFYTGVPCKRGHLSMRYVTTGGCLECLDTYKKQNAKHPTKANLVPYAPSSVWRPRHWDAATLQRCNAAVQQFIDTWKDAPPSEPERTFKYRSIFGERYYSASTVTDVAGVVHDLWFYERGDKRPPIVLRESGDPGAPLVTVTNPEASSSDPWVCIEGRWYSCSNINYALFPVIEDEHTSLVLNRFNEA